MKKIGSWFVPYLMGLLIAVEGAVIIDMAGRVELVDVLTLDKMAAMLVGVVLLLLGLLMFVPIIPSFKKKMGEGTVKRLQIAAAVIILLASLMLILIAVPANVEGIGYLGKHWVVLAGAQLFLLGLLAFVFSYYVPLEDPHMGWMEWLGMFASCLVIIEGIVIFGLRATLNIHAKLRTGPEFMTIAGVILVALGLIEMVIFNRRQEGRSERALNMLNWAGIVLSVVIGALGIITIALSTSMTLGGVTFGIQWLLLAGVQLAILGALLDYTQTLVGGNEGRAPDVGLMTTILMLIAIPIAAVL
ncbi:MAG: hypothetical protein NT131_06430 [Methanomassiliicoccales archaeon]|nr:hypothetical protein [Methanomassiliicoccales archaeon]